jgi:MaoC like domain
MRVFDSLDDLRLAAGTELGVSEWHTVTQQQIDAFADATGDHQWIHVDADRAAAGPFGTTVAHGFLSDAPNSRFGPVMSSSSRFSHARTPIREGQPAVATMAPP